MVFRANEISTTVNEANAPEAAGVATSADSLKKNTAAVSKMAIK
jgi:hypothetical protein